MEEHLKFNVAILGSTGAGKTGVFDQFFGTSKKRALDPTVFDQEVRDFTVDGKTFTLDVHEGSMSASYKELGIRRGSAFLLVYDITNRESFDEVQSLFQEIATVKDVEYPSSLNVVLCGTKCDRASKRQVSIEEGKSAAESMGCPFFETSGVTGENVEEAFAALCRRRVSPSNDNPKIAKPKDGCIVS